MHISPDLASLLATVGPIFTGTAAVIAAWHAWRSREAVHRVYLEVNSRLTELLALTAKASHAEGKLEGKTEQKVTDASK